jgi:hypothetical protein
MTLPGLDDDPVDELGPALAWIELGTPYTGDVVDPRPPACNQPSPGGKMLCILEDSHGLPHHHGQHLGVDHAGNFRGWRDRR